MLVNVDQKILQLNGEPFPDGGTFRKVVTSGLGSTYPGVIPGDDRIDGATKVQWFKLALKVEAGDPDVELSIDDAKVIKDRIGVTHGPVIVGRIYEMLEGARSSAEASASK